jgi:hypothetical protein
MQSTAREHVSLGCLYVQNHHRHCPIIHIPTFQAESATLPLLLATFLGRRDVQKDVYLPPKIGLGQWRFSNWLGTWCMWQRVVEQQHRVGQLCDNSRGRYCAHQSPTKRHSCTARVQKDVYLPPKIGLGQWRFSNWLGTWCMWQRVLNQFEKRH